MSEHDGNAYAVSIPELDQDALEAGLIARILAVPATISFSTHSSRFHLIALRISLHVGSIPRVSRRLPVRARKGFQNLSTLLRILRSGRQTKPHFHTSARLSRAGFHATASSPIACLSCETGDYFGGWRSRNQLMISGIA